MQFSTTPTLEGQTIVEYCGVVTGEAILGANIFRDFFAGIRDIVGGRSGAYEKELRKAREIAFEELGSQARALGADAVSDRRAEHDPDPAAFRIVRCARARAGHF